MRDLENLARKAASQHGLLTIQQLRKGGLTRHHLERLLAEGMLERRRAGLYCVTAAPPSWEQTQMAACLSTRPRGATSHRASLRAWRFRTIDDDIEITVRYPKTLRLPGVTVHRSRDLVASDVTYIDALPVTSVVRTLCDAGAVLPEGVVQGLVDHAIAHGFVTRRDLETFRSRVARQGRNGAGVLRRILDALPAGAESTESGPEIDLLRLCEEFGLPAPVPQHLVVIQGRRFRPDAVYPVQQVSLEYDGFADHTTPERFAADRERQNLFVLHGWIVLHFTRDDLRYHRARSAMRITDALTRRDL